MPRSHGYVKAEIYHPRIGSYPARWKEHLILLNEGANRLGFEVYSRDDDGDWQWFGFQWLDVKVSQPGATVSVGAELSDGSSPPPLEWRVYRAGPGAAAPASQAHLGVSWEFAAPDTPGEYWLDARGPLAAAVKFTVLPPDPEPLEPADPDPDPGKPGRRPTLSSSSLKAPSLGPARPRWFRSRTLSTT